MGDVLFVWTAVYQACLMQACVYRLLSGLYQLFDLCLIKHVLTVWSLTSTLACLDTKQWLMVFGRQTSSVCTGLEQFGKVLFPNFSETRSPVSSYLVPLFQNKLFVKNFSYENEFYLYENEETGGTHFHINGFARSLVLTQRQKVSQTWPFTFPFLLNRRAGIISSVL